jgi:hypothetical protein
MLNPKKLRKRGKSEKFDHRSKYRSKIGNMTAEATRHVRVWRLFLNSSQNVSCSAFCGGGVRVKTKVSSNSGEFVVDKQQEHLQTRF